MPRTNVLLISRVPGVCPKLRGGLAGGYIETGGTPEALSPSQTAVGYRAEEVFLAGTIVLGQETSPPVRFCGTAPPPPPPPLEDGGGVVQFRAPLPTPQPVGRTICSERARGRSYTAIRCKNPPYVGKIRGFRGGGGVLTRQSVSPNQTPDLGLLFRENPRI